jgi:hypothetical protein
MAVLGTWNVIITRGDGSEARINRLIHFLPSATGPGVWRLSATETGLLLAVLRRQLLGTVSHQLCMGYAA